MNLRKRKATNSPKEKRKSSSSGCNNEKRTSWSVLERVATNVGKQILTNPDEIGFNRSTFIFEGIPNFVFHMCSSAAEEEERRNMAACQFLAKCRFLYQGEKALFREYKLQEISQVKIDMLVHAIKKVEEGLQKFDLLEKSELFSMRPPVNKVVMKNFWHFVGMSVRVFRSTLHQSGQGEETFAPLSIVRTSSPSAPSAAFSNPSTATTPTSATKPVVIDLCSDDDEVELIDDVKGTDDIQATNSAGNASTSSLTLNSSRVTDMIIKTNVVEQLQENRQTGRDVLNFDYKVAGFGNNDKFLAGVRAERKCRQSPSVQEVYATGDDEDDDDDSDYEPDPKMARTDSDEHDISLNISMSPSRAVQTVQEEAQGDGNQHITSSSSDGICVGQPEDRQSPLDNLLNISVYEGYSDAADWAVKHGLPPNYEKVLLGVETDFQMVKSNEKLINLLLKTSPMAFEKMKIDAWNHYQNNIQKKEHFDKKMLIRHILLKEMELTFPGQNVQLFPVGSTINGCGAFNSDVDMCLCIPREYNHQNRFEDFPCGKQSAAKTLRTVHYKVTNNRKHPAARHIKSSELITGAKVPIIRLVMSYELDNIDVDINVNNIAGVYNSHLIHYYSLLDVRFPALALLVKHWALRAGVGDAAAGTFSSYSLILLVIHYLQCGVHPAVLPNLQKLMPDQFGDKVPLHNLILNMPQFRNQMPQRPPNVQSLAELVIGFFNYYSDFAFNKWAISIREGRKYDRTKKVLEAASLTYIEEPYGSGNVARSLNKPPNLEKVKRAFKRASIVFKQKGFDLRDIGVYI